MWRSVAPSQSRPNRHRGTARQVAGPKQAAEAAHRRLVAIDRARIGALVDRQVGIARRRIRVDLTSRPGGSVWPRSRGEPAVATGSLVPRGLARGPRLVGA